jgi:hypothetical protein
MPAAVAVVGIVLVFVGLLGLASHLGSGDCDCVSPPGLSTVPALVVAGTGAVLIGTAIAFGKRIND